MFVTLRYNRCVENAKHKLAMRNVGLRRYQVTVSQDQLVLIRQALAESDEGAKIIRALDRQVGKNLEIRARLRR